MKEIFLTVSKYLITGGSESLYDVATKAEMVDLSISQNYVSCKSWVKNHPINVGGIGGLIARTPVICGGSSGTSQLYPVYPNIIHDECYIVTENK